MRRVPLVAVALAGALPATASSPDAWAAERAAARSACLRAANLADAAVSAAIGFSDRTGQDALLVRGRYRQAFMKRARATMLCLYDRRARRAEISEAKGWTAP